MHFRTYVRGVRTVAAAVLLTVFSVSAVLAQYSDDYQKSVVQQQVRTRIINDLRGSNHQFDFNNDVRVASTTVSRMNRVYGTGRHRYNNGRWRTFSYSGVFSLRNGAVTNVNYQFTGQPGGGIVPPVSGDADMTWSGRVDDVVRIRVNGRRAITQTISGRGTTGINFNFARALPNRNVDVSVTKRDGRGSVRVIEQPTNRNGHTAVIEIRDSSGGADYYSFDLSWERRGGGSGGGIVRPPENYSGQMTWRGNVDDTVRIRISNRQATINVMRGRYPTSVSTNFRTNLPRRAVSVSVRKISGRGNVRVVEQPSRQNGYTAVVEIRDSRGGDDRYEFVADWDTYGYGGNDENNSDSQMTWRGSVDDVARVRISGRSAITRTVSGQRTTGIRFNFTNSLPRRNVDVRVEKRDGRGDVRIIQQPSARNGYTAVVEIRDRSGGRDNYEFELFW